MQPYNLSDLTIIIPTYNRSDDLKQTLHSFSNYLSKLGEVIIVDQSKDNKTKYLVNSLRNKKIKYIFSKEPSLTRARNLGILKTSKKSRIIGFLDDDVTLGKDYLPKIIETFNKNQPNAVGIWFKPPVVIKSYEQFAKKLFFIEHLGKDSCRALSAYGNTYPYALSKPINAQWLPGFNMFFTSKILNEFNFDENLGRYGLAEDFDITYRIHKKYPKSIILTPEANIVHRASTIERYPTEKSAYMNQIHHLYLNFKNFNSSWTEKLIFCWSLFGILILRMLYLIKTLRKEEALKLWFFIKSLAYSFMNLRKIKRGNLRELLSNIN